uniref:Uncharacterized protein n=1 Tax=Globodera rostochiensis TaxID=31243 RepID=A0A914GYT2_GLORO
MGGNPFHLLRASSLFPFSLSRETENKRGNTHARMQTDRVRTKTDLLFYARSWTPNPNRMLVFSTCFRISAQVHSSAQPNAFEPRGRRRFYQNMDAFLALAGSAHMAPLYHELTAIVDAQKYTPMFCVHSNIATGCPSFTITRKGSENRARPNLGDGDALVNIESLRVCQKWMDEGKLVKKVLEMDGPSHMAILQEDRFFKAVETIMGF